MIQKVGEVGQSHSTRSSKEKAPNYMNGQANRSSFLKYLQDKAKEGSHKEPQKKLVPKKDIVEISSKGKAFCEREK